MKRSHQPSRTLWEKRVRRVIADRKQVGAPSTSPQDSCHTSNRPAPKTLEVVGDGPAKQVEETANEPLRLGFRKGRAGGAPGSRSG